MSVLTSSAQLLNLTKPYLPLEFNKANIRKTLLFGVELVGLTCAGIFLAFSVEASVNSFLVKPNITSTNPVANQTNHDISSPIEISFDHAADFEKLKPSLDPQVPGTWSVKQGLFGKTFSDKLIFTPSLTLPADTKFTVTLKNIGSRYGFDQPYDYQFVFKTQTLPKIVGSNLKPASSNINPSSEIKFNLDKPNNYAANLSFKMTPEAKFTPKLSEDKSYYTLNLHSPLKQGTTYEVIISKAQISYDLLNKKVLREEEFVPEYNLVFTTLSAPSLASVSASGDSVAVTSPVSVVFSKDMDRNSVEKGFKTSLPSYEVSWSDDKTFIITPKEKLAFNTTYSFTFSSGSLAKDGSWFENDFTHNFTTIGNVKVGSFSPANGATNVNIGTKIQVYFNQPVDKANAQSKFSISPNVTGSFSWSGNTLIFTPAVNLTYNSSYQVKIASGVKSLTALDSVSEFSGIFKTGDLYETVKLAVPVYKQKYTLSCEFASMRMALAFKGVQKSEDELIAETPFDMTPNSGSVWGDPYAGFVGNVNGTYFGDGYGAYYPVIVNEVGRYRTAEPHVGWNLTSLLQEVKAGNPAIIWSCLICNKPRYWNTPGGKQIYAYEYYHMMVVVGYTGNVDNPQSIILNDSYSGKQISYSKSSFLSRWSIMNNTAVVVK